jgi:hypothetical protein
MEYDLEQELNDCEWLVAKVRGSDTYAQNLYAAMCNMQWQKQDTWPIIKDDLWSCSWRYAGGIVADIQNRGGDYMDWYCSGMGSGLGNGDTDGTKGYVGESVVTDEIAEDLKKIGWIPVEWPEDNG